MNDRTLFPLGPATGALKEREEQALEHLTANPDGVRSIDLGRHLHMLRSCPYCAPDRYCRYAHSAGEEVGRQLRKRDLAIKRKQSGRWQLLRPARQDDDTPIPY